MATQSFKPAAHNFRQNVNKALILVLMIAFLGYFLIPLFWLLISSTKTNAGLFNTFGFWFGKNINFIQNLKDLLAYDKGHFVLWIRNTAVYAVIAALGSSLISTLAGYTFAKYQFAGRDVLFGVVLASVFVPATVFAVPLFLMMSKSGLSNSLWAIILPSLTRQAALS